MLTLEVFCVTAVASDGSADWKTLGNIITADLLGQVSAFFLIIYIYYSFDTGEYHESVGLVFTRVPLARA